MLGVDADTLRRIEQGDPTSRAELLRLADRYLNIADALTSAKKLPAMTDGDGRPLVYWMRTGLGLNAMEAATALRCQRQDIMCLEDGAHPMPEDILQARWIRYVTWGRKELAKLVPDGLAAPTPPAPVTLRKGWTSKDVAELQRAVPRRAVGRSGRTRCCDGGRRHRARRSKQGVQQADGTGKRPTPGNARNRIMETCSRRGRDHDGGCGICSSYYRT